MAYHEMANHGNLIGIHIPWWFVIEGLVYDIWQVFTILTLALWHDLKAKIISHHKVRYKNNFVLCTFNLVF